MISLRADRRSLLLAALIFSILSTIAGVTSKGFLEADACTHYQYARFAFAEPYRFVDVWGRPWCTFVYSVPAVLGGRAGVHLVSLAIALGVAELTRRIASLQGDARSELAFIFVLAQPLVFLHSFSELTELPFTVLLAAGFLFYRQRRWWPFAMAVGLMPLARPEGFGFLVLGVIALCLHRRMRWLPLVMLPLVAWDVAGWVLSGRGGEWYGWLAANWPYASQSLYTPGPLWHFTALLPTLVGPFLFPATCIGTFLILSVTLEFLRRPWSFFKMDHVTRCDFLIAAIPLAVLAGHSLLYWRGKMASNGELRYLLILAPFFGILTARGFGFVATRLRFRHPLGVAAIAALLPLFINVPFVGYPVVPLAVMPDWTDAERLGRWYQKSPLLRDYPYLVNSHPGVPYAMDISPNDERRTRPFTRKTIQQAKAGSILIWDPVYGIYNADASRSIPLPEILAAGWIPFTPPASLRLRSEWRLFLSARSIQDQPTRLPAIKGSDNNADRFPVN